MQRDNKISANKNPKFPGKHFWFPTASRELGQPCKGSKQCFLREAPITSGTAQDHCPSVRCPPVRPRFWWFLRRVQACVTGSYPPRQFFRSQIRVLKKTFTNWDLRIGIHLDWTPFWTLFLEQKIKDFHLFWAKNRFFSNKMFLQPKKYPNILVQKMVKMIDKCASRHLPCRV